MNEIIKYKKELKAHRKIIILDISVLIIGFLFIYIFLLVISDTIKQGIINGIFFYLDSIPASSTIALKYLLPIGFQVLFLLFCGSLLKIIKGDKRSKQIFIAISFVILLLSILLVNALSPFFIKIMNHNSLIGLSASQVSIKALVDFQFELWIILNSLVLPSLFAYIKIIRKNFFTKNLFLVLAFILLMAALKTAPDVFSLIIYSIALSLLVILGLLLSKLFITNEKIKINHTTRNLFFFLCSFVFLMFLLVVNHSNISLPKIIIIASVFILYQNIIFIWDIYRINKIAGILSFIVPFYLPYAMLKKRDEISGNKLFKEIYAIFLIILNIIAIIKFTM